MKFSICSAVNNEEVLRSCLLSSPDLGEAGELILRRGCSSASEAYNAALDAAKNDIVILIHQDVYLPHGWFRHLETALRKLAESDPIWGVLGVFGVTSSSIFHGHLYCNASQAILGQPFREPTEVRSLDEVLLIVRKSSGIRFDPRLGGFHFYATDICLNASKRGLKCYAIPAFCFHNANAYGLFPRSFWHGYFYLRRKWRSILPVKTPCIEITSSLKPYLLGTVWRFCWLKKSRRPLARRVEDPAAMWKKLMQTEPEKLNDVFSAGVQLGSATPTLSPGVGRKI